MDHTAFATFTSGELPTQEDHPDLFINTTELDEARASFQYIRRVAHGHSRMKIDHDERGQTVYYKQIPVATRSLGPKEKIVFYDNPIFRLLGLGSKLDAH